MSENDNLYLCAENFKAATDFNYYFVTGNNKRILMNLKISSFIEEFTHIVGLDHLYDIQPFSEKRYNKSKAFQYILSKELTEKDLFESKFYLSPILNTYNVLEKREYTIAQRIAALIDIQFYLDNAYKGRLYQWQKYNSAIPQPNGTIRKSNINADYLLIVPSKKDKENICFFMYDASHYIKNKEKDIIYLNIFSAFPEGLEIYKGQEKPYTILQEKKINVKANSEVLLYQHPKYKDPAVASKCIEKLDEINQISNKIADAIDNGEIGKEQEQTLPGRSK